MATLSLQVDTWTGAGTVYTASELLEAYAGPGHRVGDLEELADELVASLSAQHWATKIDRGVYLVED